jgi:hemophore-related protein
MVKLSSTRLAVVIGGLALSWATGIGVASADPDLSPLINTTCSYAQAMAALNAQSPDAAAAFNASPVAQVWLGSFLAAPPDQRQRMLQALRGGRAQQYLGPALQAANTCNNY